MSMPQKLSVVFHRKPLDNSKGFTIVELMIATMVFSTILLVITYGVLSFTKSYYRGVNSSTTQNTARSVIDTVTQAIQFSGSSITPTTTQGFLTQYVCAGGYIYIYKPGIQYTGTTSGLTPGLYTVPTSSCDPNAVTYVETAGKQLLSPHMRVAYFNVSKDTNQARAYNVTLRIAYSSGGSGTDEGSDLLTATTGNTVQCLSQTGSQFCAVTGLSTTVVKRVED